MQQQLLSEELAPWLAGYLSQSRHELDLQAIEPPYREGDLYERLQAGEVLSKLGGLRTLYLESDTTSCFINGERIQLPERGTALARQLCDRVEFSANGWETELTDPAILAWLTQLVNSGYWYFANDWDDEE